MASTEGDHNGFMLLVDLLTNFSKLDCLLIHTANLLEVLIQQRLIYLFKKYLLLCLKFKVTHLRMKKRMTILHQCPISPAIILKVKVISKKDISRTAFLPYK